jgi:hypothetical protein
MARKPKVHEDKKRYYVTSGFTHDGVALRPGANVYLTEAEARDLKSINFIRDMRAGDNNGEYGRRDMRAAH